MPRLEAPRPPPGGYEIELSGVRLHLLATVFGLASEGERVTRSLGDDDPDFVGLGVPPEDITSLAKLTARGPIALPPEPSPGERAVFAADALGAPGPEGILGAAVGKVPGWAAPAGSEAGTEPEFYATRDTRVFLQLLSRHAPVELPPRELLAAYRWAEANGRPAHPLDLDDEAHSSLYVREVTVFQLMRQTRRLKRLYARGLDAPGPRELSVAWDAAVNEGKGLETVERTREAHMAERLAELCLEVDARARGGGHAVRRRVLAIVPLERSEGVARCLVERKGARLLATHA